jgi:hypothetical protein
MKRLHRSALLWASVVLLAVVGTAVVSAGVMSQTGGSSSSVDPTPFPTQVLPALLPPTPGGTPFVPAPGPQAASLPPIPVAADLQKDVSGRFFVSNKGGCSWAEETRGKDSTTNQDLIILDTPCRQDLILHYYPASGVVEGVIRLIQSIGPAATPTPQVQGTPVVAVATASTAVTP